MPTYTLRDNADGREWTEFMSISAGTQYCIDNPTCEILITGTTPIVSGVASARNKPDDSFRDILRNVKKKHSQGFTQANIETF